jgi:hypothetical protein
MLSHYGLKGALERIRHFVIPSEGISSSALMPGVVAFSGAGVSTLPVGGHKRAILAVALHFIPGFSRHGRISAL